MKRNRVLFVILARLSLWLTVLFFALAGLKAETVTLHSGNGSLGSADAKVSFVAGPKDAGFSSSFSQTDFDAARNGTPASIVEHYSSWIANFAVDNVLGDNANAGIFLNGTPLTTSAISGSYVSQSTLSQSAIAPLLRLGTNTLYVYALNLGGPAGLLFRATISTHNAIFISRSDAALTGTPSVPGDGVSIRLFNGIGGGGPPLPSTIASLTPDGTTLSPFIDFPHPNQTINVGQSFASFFADTANPPDQVKNLAAGNFITENHFYLLATGEMDRDPTTPEIDVRLSVGSDDGFYLKVGSRFIGSSGDRSFGVSTFDLSFETPGLYEVTLLFAANASGQSGLEFSWSTALTNGFEIVPQAALYTSTSVGQRLITFDDLANATPVSDQFRSAGIIFHVVSGDLQATTAFPNDFIPVTQPNVVGSPTAAPSSSQILEMTFVVPGTTQPATTSFFQCFVIDADSTPGARFVAVNDLGQTVFDQQVVTGGGAQQALTISSPKIAKVTAYLGGAGVDTSAIDNVAFNTPIKIPDNVAAALTLQISPASITEGGTQPAASGSVARNGSTFMPLTVSLVSDQLDSVTVPASVTIPAGAATASFPISTVNDNVLKPTRNVHVIASAPDYANASAQLEVLDDDIPDFVLDLSADSVSEGAPNPALYGTILRTQTTARDTIYVLQSSLPQSASVPAQVTLPANQTSVSFPITVPNNTTVDGTRTATIYARETDPILHQILPGQEAADSLTIFDDEGNSLSVSFSAATVVSGQSVSGTVTRAGGANGSALTVLLASSVPATLSAPASVTIPSGAASVNFAASAAGGLTIDRDVTVTATAAGYNAGAQTVTAITSERPDLAVTTITLPANAGSTGENLTVEYSVINDGSATAAGAWSDYIYFSPTPQPDLSQASAAAAITGPLPTGQGYSRSVQAPLPTRQGRYWVVVKTDALGAVIEGSENNNTLVCPTPVDVGPAYTATVTPSVGVAVNGTPIVLQGRAYHPENNQPAANVPVTIRVRSRGTRRVLTAFSDQTGAFSTTFQPLPTEAGTYLVGADHPSVETDSTQGQFVLLGIGAQPGALTARLVPGAALTGTVTIVNHSDQALAGLVASLQTAAPNLSAQFALPDSVPADGQVTLTYTLRASDSSYPTIGAHIHVTTASGASTDVPLDVSVLDAPSQLVTDPGVIERSMVRGTQATTDFTITNLGSTPTGPLEISVPALPWLAVATPSPLPSIDPGKSAKISLLLTPAADLPLQLTTGSVVVRGAAVSASVPFRITSTSDSKASVQVEVKDDFTFYAAGAPRVAGATVRLRDPYDQSIIRAEGVSDANGMAVFNDLAEGPYVLDVSATRHANYRQVTLLQPGATNPKTVFIARLTVSYVWDVVPTEVPDEYDVHLLSTFETDVPVPVLTVEASPNDLPDLAEGESFQFNVKIVNHGLIAAQKASLQVPGPEFGYVFTALVSDLGDIPAHGEVNVPVTATRPKGTAHISRPSGKLTPRATSGDGGCSNPFVIVIHSYTCGNDRVWHQSGDLLKIQGRVACPAGGGDIHPVAPPPGDGGNGDTQTYTPVQQDYSCVPCADIIVPALLDCAAGFIPGNFAHAARCAHSGYECGKSLGEPSQLFAVGKCISAILECSGEIPGWGLIINLYDCDLDLEEAYEKCKEREGEGKLAAAARKINAAAPRVSETYLDTRVDVLRARTDRLGVILAPIIYTIGDRGWFLSPDSTAFSAWLTGLAEAIDAGSPGGFQITAEERAHLLGMTVPQGVTTAMVSAVLARFDRTNDYWNRGYRNSTDLPAGLNPDYIAQDVFAQQTAAAATADTANFVEGFSDPGSSLLDAVAQVRGAVPTTQGVCARVRLEIDQQAVLAREVFVGTLELDNGSETDQLTNVQMTVDIRDAAGTSSNGKFFVKGPTTSGFPSDGQLPPGTTGKLEYTFVPTHAAASSGPATYTFSGVLSFTQNGVPVTIPLLGSTVTVYPDASLNLRYFQQRAVYSDDPFTPEIEPAEPFALGVMAINTGLGTAKDFRITSSQPKIIDNEKGLLIDFKIIGAQVGSQAVSPSLTVDLGDIAPGQTQVAQFLLTSTLQGKFIEYDASFEHNADLGGQVTSLIDSIEIHELVHSVLTDRAGDDQVPDFLTNEVADVNALPDTLYLSDGSIAAVNPASTPVVDAPISASHLQAQLTAQMPNGWSYLEVADPGPDYLLTGATRSDGKTILVGPNIWQTNRTFSNASTGATRQTLLHLFDYNGTGSYTLSYAAAGSIPITIALGGNGDIIGGAPFVRSGVFTASIPHPTWSGTVDYGDGMGPQPLLIAYNGSYVLNHSYLLDGQYTVTVSVNDGANSASSSLQVTVAGATALSIPTVNGASGVSAMVGQPFTYQVVASNRPARYVAVGLPAGLSIDEANGLISGVPGVPGTSQVTVSASNAYGTGVGTLTITVAPIPNGVPIITGPFTADATVGQGFVYQIIATNDPQARAASSLPPGLVVDAASGLITGVPTQSGVYNVTLSARNGFGTTYAILTLTIRDGSTAFPTITSPTTAAGMVGQPFSFQVTATNQPSTFAASGLPAGLAIDALSGLIAGTPVSGGSFNIGLTAANAAGIGSGTLALTIQPEATPPPGTQPPVIDSALTVDAQATVPFAYQITATSDPTQFGAENLPEGLSVDSPTGLISGIPTTPGTVAVTLSATNVLGSGTAALTIRIAKMPLPVVTARVKPARATANSGRPVKLMLTLSAPQGKDLKVKLRLTGSAVNGVDYSPFPTEVDIPAGSIKGKVKIYAIGDLDGLPKKTIKITLKPNKHYEIGTPESLKIKIFPSP